MDYSSIKTPETKAYSTRSISLSRYEVTCFSVKTCGHIDQPKHSTLQSPLSLHYHWLRDEKSSRPLQSIYLRLNTRIKTHMSTSSQSISNSPPLPVMNRVRWTCERALKPVRWLSRRTARIAEVNNFSHDYPQPPGLKGPVEQVPQSK